MSQLNIPKYFWLCLTLESLIIWSSGYPPLVAQIKEGKENERPTVIGERLCGQNTLPAPISTSKNMAYVHFRSDSSVAHNGFRLEWHVHGG